MNLFSQVQEHHIRSAIKNIDKQGLKEFSDSRYYDVLFENKRYPPKPLLVIANELATGTRIKTTDFDGGEGTPAFNRLNQLGFTIVSKVRESDEDFSEELHKFISQSNTNNLKTKGYKQTFRGLKVKVSFGQGAVARVPWISFLGKNQTTSEGIYPVYLLYKKEGILILAYGISETHKPQINWNLSEVETIKQFFVQLKKAPDRYGDSLVFKSYKLSSLPSSNTLNRDIFEIIEYYKKRLKMSSVNNLTPSPSKGFDCQEFIKVSNNVGLKFAPLLITRFLASLCTKPFVILTGLSGSGKTKIALSFVQWICKDDTQYALVPVGADWTNREPLLGFPNALNSKEYVEPESGVLKLLINAVENPNLPYFLILDEMNLSHVERYFADFLSAMETGEPIRLHSSEGCAVPESIQIPKNLFIIGTVNIDETTYMFSAKVLDRANTIEFRISEKELSEFLDSNKALKLEEMKHKGAEMAMDFVRIAAINDIVSSTAVNEKLVSFFIELKKAGAEFGFRTANEIQILIGHLERLDPKLIENRKLDIAIMQKLLPRLHGSRRKLEKTLFTLCKLCLIDNTDEESLKKYFTGEIPAKSDDLNVLFPISLEKIQRMYQGAVDHGFTSYAEA